MKLACRFGLCLTALVWVCAEPAQADAVKLSGWFACEKCTASRCEGRSPSSNPECARVCIDKGSEGVFISEQRKESLMVRNYPSIKEDLGITSRSPEKLIRPPRRFRSRQSRGSNMKEPHARASNGTRK